MSSLGFLQTRSADRDEPRQSTKGPAVLSWLPTHDNINGALREVRAQPDPSQRLRTLVSLAGFDRDMVTTAKLDRVLAELPDAADDIIVDGLVPVRLAILSSHTVDHLTPSIRVAGLSRGVLLKLHVGNFGLYRQALFAGDPDLEAFAPNIVLLALDEQALVPALPLATPGAEVAEAIGRQIDELRTLWAAVRRRYSAQPVQQTLLPMSPSVFGSFDGRVAASPRVMCEAINAAIRRAASDDEVLLVDVDWQMPAHASDSDLIDPVRWHQAKQLINPVVAPIYGDLVARLAAATVGRSRKCLVLDLDNTLWGGVVGDDGFDGIRLGHGSAEGEGHLALQHYVSQLAERGVILAVCSKNDHEIAWNAFVNHPDMAIAATSIACFIANWSDKATNLREIARRLNIGLDSLVFVDDNPAERAIVRQELPDVAVPELPDDVADYPARLAEAGYFEPAALTADDFSRGSAYAANSGRDALLDVTTDMDQFLQSLGMTMTVMPIAAADLPRSAQLINKSNQFNLTTRRRTEVELRSFLDDPQAVGLCFRLADRFGDNGLISVILARPDQRLPIDEMLIDTWLMSCRVLGRGVEAAALEVLAQAARAKGVVGLVGEFRPSGRNAMVAEHYRSLGFVPIEPLADRPGSTFWRLEIGDMPLPSHFIAWDRGA